MKTISLLLVSMVLIINAYSQEVSTVLAIALDGPNGFAMDSTDNLFIACEPGKKVLKLTPAGDLSVVAKCDSPSGLAIDSKGRLYISNFFSGILLRITDGKIDTVSKTLHKPADVKVDGRGNVFVAEYERNDIIVISPEGGARVFATGFKNPFGLVFDDKEDLYVANNAGRISRVTKSGLVSTFAELSTSISFLAFSKKNRKFYVPAFRQHVIYVVSIEGKSTVLAGTGIPGHKDGALKDAQFDGPNSVALSSRGDLFFSEFNGNRVRKISKVK